MNSALLATGGAIDFGSIFTDLAIILIVAKIAAELCERIRVPAVLGEIFGGHHHWPVNAWLHRPQRRDTNAGRSWPDYFAGRSGP